MRLKKSFSTLLETAGIMSIVAGVAGLAGTFWALIAGGVTAVLYSAALSR